MQVRVNLVFWVQMWFHMGSRRSTRQTSHLVVLTYQDSRSARELVCPNHINITFVESHIFIDFFKGFITRHPVFAPSTTPIYSNVAYQILAYAIENISNNRPFNSILLDDMLKPLCMTRTSTSTPNSSIVAIPGGVEGSGWDVDIGDETP
jgi:hypothetical protein